MPEKKTNPWSKITSKVVMRNHYTYADGTRTLILQIFVDGVRRKYPLDINVLPSQWNALKMQISSRAPDSEDANLVIKSALARCSEIAVQCRLRGEKISIAQFEVRYFHDETQSFIQFWRIRMKELSNQLGARTLDHHEVVLGKLVEYCGDITFGEVDAAFIRGFQRHLKTKYGNKHNTIMSNLSKVRKYVNLAIHEGRMTKSPFKQVKIKLQDSHRTALSQEQIRELMALWRRRTLEGGKKAALQNFLLGCFTGLRIGDVYKIRKDMIEGNLLVFEPDKGRNKNQVIEIPITDMAQKFIAAGGDHIAERLSHAKTNEYLKVIQNMVGFKQKLTFHVSRHSFATIYLELGGSVEVLQRILGHSDIKTTMIYVHIANSRKEAQMALFDKVKWE